MGLGIDWIDRSFCPNMGRSVCGGFRVHEGQVCLREVSKYRQIVGFDLCGVSPGHSSEWNVDVGARVLDKLAGFAFSSRSHQ